MNAELPGSYVPLDQATAAVPPWPAWAMPEAKVFALGIDVGQVHDYTALVVARAETKLAKEADWLSSRPPEYETHFRILGCERLPLGTSYPAVGLRICTLARRLRDRHSDAYLVALVDATGVGRPVVDSLRAHIVPQCHVSAVTLTGGSKWDEALFYRTDAAVSKIGLVSRLQSLLQAGRILMPRSPETDAVAQELKDFSLKARPSGSIESGAFDVGQHDDLVTALALATAQDFSAPHTGPSLDLYPSPRL